MKKQIAHATRCWLGIALGLGWAIGLPSLTLAQTAPSNIVPDGTLGAERSRLITSGGFDFIDSGAQRGQNLFHSFSAFNVGAGRGAYFVIPDNVVRNVLTRVTGGSRSEILGTLGTFRPSDGAVGVPGVNLFLLNPNGIMFGENASLNIGGSFFATTANAVQLGNAGLFSASQPASNNLLNVNPSAFLFNQIAAQGQIINRSQANQTVVGNPTTGLQVPNGETLMILGGNVILESGQLFTAGGSIEIGAVAGKGVVEIAGSHSSLRFSIPHDLSRADVVLQNGAFALATGGGGLTVQSRNVTLEGGSFLGSTLNASEGGLDRPTGNVEVNAAGLVQVDRSFIFSSTSPGSLGNSGNITINARSIRLTNKGQVGLVGVQNQSTIRLTASEDVTIDQGLVTALPARETVGNSGNLAIAAQTININGGSLDVSNIGRGRTGKINLQAQGTIALSGAGSIKSSSGATQFGGTNTEPGGDIEIQARSLSLQDSNSFISSGSFDPARGGNIQITTDNSITLTGNSFITSRAFRSGDAGNLTLNTTWLSIRDGASVGSGTSIGSSGQGGNLLINAANGVEVVGTSLDQQSSSRIEADTKGSGKAGSLTINTRRLSVRDEGLISTTSATTDVGQGGDLTINAIDAVEVVGGSPDGQYGSALTTASYNVTNAGRLTLRTSLLTTRGQGFISTQTYSAGRGGDLTVTAQNVEIVGKPVNPGGLFASAGGAGDAGNLTISTQRLSVRDGGAISSATGSDSIGKGGNLTITATNAVEIVGTRDNFSLLSVRSNGTGAAGTLTLTTPRLTLHNQGSITAESRAADGGNIVLNIPNLLLLRNGSKITATAGTANARGNGGNITVNSRFIIAIPQENSDISANAFTGSGGKVNITSQGIFGLKFRPQLTNLSDITASSKFGVSGVTSINSPDTSFLQNSLTEFPQTFTDTTQLLANSCIVRRGQPNGSFTITGSGGLPQRPGEAPVSSFPTGEVRSVPTGRQRKQEGQGERSENPYSTQNSKLITQNSLDRPWEIGDPIVEPQGVYQLANGELVMSRECK